MTRFMQFFKWVGKAWPVLWILLIVSLHILFTSVPIFEKALVNELIGMALPFIGVFFILYSINEDFQDFRNSTMLSSFKEYLKSCPFKKQNYMLDANSTNFLFTVGKPQLYVNKTWTTTEEGLKELERRIEDLRKYVGMSCKDTGEEINQLRSQFKTMDGQNKEKLNQVSNQLDKSVMGKVIHQIFGVLLIIYGFIVNLLLLF